MNLSRYSIPIALVSGVIAFVITYFALSHANWVGVFSLGGAALVFILVVLGVWLVTDSRTSQQVQLDTYAVTAESEVEKVLTKLDQIRKLTQRIRSSETKELLLQTCSDVDQLLRRIRQYNQTTLFSAATTLDGYVEKIVLAAEKYIDIQSFPRYYTKPTELLSQIQSGLTSFEEYVVASIQGVQAGEQLGLDVDLKLLDAAKYSRLT
jgi:hypothetical protein